MKLKEVCAQTGLSKKTVRFYEMKGLIQPGKERRNGRDYREYTQEDVERLREIATLRRARFTVQEIRQMETEPQSLGDIFLRYREGLHAEQRELEALIAAADRVEPGNLTSAKALIGLLEGAASALPLPAVDVRPRFRYLDDLEKPDPAFRRSRLEQRRREDLRIGVNSAVTGAAYQKGNPRSLELGNEQKLAVMNLLRDGEK